MLYLHFVLLYSDIVVAVVHVYASILCPQPHGRLIDILLYRRVIDTWNITTQCQATRICTWNVVRVQFVGARATAVQFCFFRSPMRHNK